MTALNEKTDMSIDKMSAKTASDEGYLTEKDKEALRIYRLSAAELLARDLDERGIAVEKDDKEPRRAARVTLRHLWNRILGRNASQVYLDHLESE